tara:strand:- start:520 stop:648 length:129 start_codon:yes stop_codon:yes gene_type:complete
MGDKEGKPEKEHPEGYQQERYYPGEYGEFRRDALQGSVLLYL